MPKGVTTRPGTRNHVRAAVIQSSALSVACYVSYWPITQVHSLAAADDRLGTVVPLGQLAK
jgi:hypothetical protein